MHLCALRTGMRLVEGGRIELPKNEKMCRVALSLVLAETLQRLRAQDTLARGWTQLPDWVFCNGEGRPL
jgi:hypothetical protein